MTKITQIFLFTSFMAMIMPFAYASKKQAHIIFDVHGVHNEALKNVKKALQAEKASISKPIKPQEIRAFYESSDGYIRKALAPYGYFHVHVQSSLKKQNGRWLTHYQIDPGPRTRIIHKDIKLLGPGQHNPTLQQLIQKMPQKLGTFLNTEIYKQLKEHFFNVAQSQGYLKADATKHTIQVDKSDNTAQITLHFHTGRRYYFGQVHFSKNPYREDFLRRYLPFKQGEYYTADKLLTLQDNLANTIYFQQVDIKPKNKHTQNHHIPIDVVVKPVPSQKYNFGIGFGTDTGARGSLGWQWRRATRAGHRIESQLQISQKMNNSFQLRYIIPGQNPVTSQYNLTAGLFTNNPGKKDQKYTVAQIGASYSVHKNDWHRTMALNLHQEKSKQQINGSGLQDHRSISLIPSLYFENIQANNRIDTDQGHRFYFNFEGGLVNNNWNSWLLGGSGNFIQGEFKGNYIHSFHQKDYRLLLRGSFGLTAVNHFTDMPLSQKFFAGGSQSIRGFDYQELGPGRYLMVGSTELQRRLYGNIYSAAFIDAGNAFRNFPINAKFSYGIGLLYRSPIGSIEITVAKPSTKEFSLKHLKIQFSMGPDL